MVDPNRKINRHNSAHIEFLDEAEEEFANRFTDNDYKFVDHCNKTQPMPPILINYNTPYNQNQQSNEREQNSANRRGSWGRRPRRGGNYRGGNNQGERRYHPYENRDRFNKPGRNHDNYQQRSFNHNDNQQRNYNDYPQGNYKDEEQSSNDTQNETAQTRRPAINVPRNYSNFVAASKD